MDHTLPIDEIDIGQRYRKDLGDLKVLAESIESVGLLHPVVVTPDQRLIAGQRRLRACESLGWTEVPVTVIDLEELARGVWKRIAGEGAERKTLDIPAPAEHGGLADQDDVPAVEVHVFVGCVVGRRLAEDVEGLL